MRRALGLLAALAAAAAATASAQAHAVTLARLDTTRDGRPQVAVHVSNLLDDPEWLDPWQSAYVIQIHWKVQLLRKAIFRTVQSTVEWDVLVQQVPQMDLFNYTERISGRLPNTISFRTLDSLKAHLVEDVGIPATSAARKLAPGDYFFRIDVTLSTSEKDPFDLRPSADVGVFQKLAGLLPGGNHSRDLPTVDRNFTVH
jgi:hypothetical protein